MYLTREELIAKIQDIEWDDFEAKASRERLTGEKVEFATDVMSITVTYWRPKVGTSMRRSEGSEGTTPKTTPRTTPTISKAELADLLRITTDGVTYHVRILRKKLCVTGRDQA